MRATFSMSEVEIHTSTPLYANAVADVFYNNIMDMKTFYFIDLTTVFFIN